jgi:hypothetical protein
MSNNIVQFPFKKRIVVDNTGAQVREHMLFTENLTEGLVVNMIHNMAENGIDVDQPDFLRDTSFLIELVKSMIYRDGELDHPLQDFTKMFTAYIEEEDGSSTLDINLDMIKDVSEGFGEKDDEE